MLRVVSSQDKPSGLEINSELSQLVAWGGEVNFVKDEGPQGNLLEMGKMDGLCWRSPKEGNKDDSEALHPVQWECRHLPLKIPSARRKGIFLDWEMEKCTFVTSRTNALHKSNAVLQRVDGAERGGQKGAPTVSCLRPRTCPPRGAALAETAPVMFFIWTDGTMVGSLLPTRSSLRGVRGFPKVDGVTVAELRIEPTSRPFLHVREHLSSSVIMVADTTALTPQHRQHVEEMWTIWAAPGAEGGERKSKAGCRSLGIICLG